MANLYNELGVTIAQHHRGWARLLLGDPAGATSDFSACLALSSRLRHVEGVAYALEGLVAVAALALALSACGAKTAVGLAASHSAVLKASPPRGAGAGAPSTGSARPGPA